MSRKIERRKRFSHRLTQIYTDLFLERFKTFTTETLSHGVFKLFSVIP